MIATKLFNKKIAPLMLVILMVVSVCAGSIVTLSSVAAQTDTMQFRYNAAHTGDYSAVAGNVEPLPRLKWSYETGYSVISCPTVANGLAYFGSRDGNFYAVDSATGQLKWFRAGVYGAWSSPAVANGVVYVGNGGSSPAVADGVVYMGSGSGSTYLYALDAGSGALKWTQFLGHDAPGYLHALDAESGAIKWQHKVGDGGDVTPAVANGVVYIGGGFRADPDTPSHYGIVSALHASDGTELWSYTSTVSTSGFTSPAVVDGVVCVGMSEHTGYNSGVYALDAATGNLKWQHTTSRQVASSPAAVNGVVYIADLSGYLYALDTADGTQVWRSYLNALPNSANQGSDPAVANGVVYIGGADSFLYAVNANDGSVKWSYQTEDAPTRSPAVVDGVIYMGSGNKLIALGDRAPIANAGPDQIIKAKGTVQLDGSGSSDPDGDSFTYLWKLIGTPDKSKAQLTGETTATPTLTTDKAGTYTIQLTVTDEHGLWSSDEVVVTAVNKMPK